MDPWLDNPGMPVLNVDQQDNLLKLSQNRFIVTNYQNDSKSLWPIPLLIDEGSKQSIMFTKSQSITIDSTDYVTVNGGASGHYITNYTNPKHFDYVAEQIAKMTISSPDRINRLNDLLLLSKSNALEFVKLLDLIEQMTNENRYAVWSLMARVFSNAINLTAGDEDTKDRINKFRIKLASKNFSSLGITDKTDDGTNAILLRSLTFSIMLAAKNPEALNNALDMMSDVSGPSMLPSELRPSILSALIKNDDISLFNNLVSTYPESNTDMQLDITTALTSVENQDLAQQLIKRVLNEDGYVRDQDLIRWLALFARNKKVKEAIWDQISANWQIIEKRMKESKSFDYLPTYLASSINTDDMASRYHKLFKPLKDNKILRQNITIALKQIDSQIVWRTNNEQAICSWFKQL